MKAGLPSFCRKPPATCRVNKTIIASFFFVLPPNMYAFMTQTTCLRGQWPSRCGVFVPVHCAVFSQVPGSVQEQTLPSRHGGATGMKPQMSSRGIKSVTCCDFSLSTILPRTGKIVSIPLGSGCDFTGCFEIHSSFLGGPDEPLAPPSSDRLKSANTFTQNTSARRH